LKNQITSDEFAENILGFEEVEEGDEENELADGAMTGDNFNNSMGDSNMRGVPEMVPEVDGF
jgi:hypothetical protein